MWEGQLNAGKQVFDAPANMTARFNPAPRVIKPVEVYFDGAHPMVQLRVVAFYRAGIGTAGGDPRF